MVQSGTPPPGGGYPPQGYPPAQGQPPAGYPPPDAYGAGGGPGGPAGYGGYPAPPQRSAIPKVIGILMIIFGSLGLLGVLIGLASGGGGMFSQGDEFTRKFYAETATYTRLTNLIGLPIAVLQIVAGIWALRYRRAAPMLATTYAVVSILNQLVALVLLFSYVLPALEKSLPPIIAEKMRGVMIVAAVFGAIIGMAWQVVVLILMNRPKAKEACVN